MNSTNQQAESIFSTALELSDAEQRRAYLEQSCAGNEALQRDVYTLLSAHDRAGDFLETLPGFGLPTILPFEERPRRFGDYELLEEIDRGGMGVVYKARQISLNRTVAVKMILTGRLASESAVKRFHSEAEAAGCLNHPNIVGIYEVGQQDGHHYYSMPLVEGLSLAQLVESGQWQAGDGIEAARLLAKLARAMQHAHQQGILHRDLKPGNILMDRDGEPRVLDFGLAKRLMGDISETLSSGILGTPSFMAPEQAAGKAKTATATADIYSLGAVLYYLLTGRPPFVADSLLDALLLAIEGDAVQPRAVNPRIAPDLERICMRCLAKSPEDRYLAAGDLAEDLDRFLRDEPLLAHPPGWTHRLRSWANRQPALVSRLAGLTACAMISQAGYQADYQIWPNATQVQPEHQHMEVMAVMGVWAIICYLCQWALKNERWAGKVRFIWAGLDALMLTVILLVDQALESPLIAMYPVWIAGSGLWLRVPVVVLTTAMAVLGYGLLILDELLRGSPVHPPIHWPLHWHIVIVAMLILTGFIVSYLVHRVRVMSQFHERRPVPLK